MDLSTKRLISISLSLAVLAAACLGLSGAVAQERPRPGCSACLLIADDGRVLFERRASVPLPNASSTKMITALVVTAAEGNLDQELSVSAAAAATPGGKLSLSVGERLSVRELLAALMLNSSNDAAVALAEHVAGSVGAFVDLMNSTAASLGAVASHFVTPHGLDTEGHVSTAEDLAVIGEAVLADPILADLVARPTMSIITSTGPVELENTNLLLDSYRGAIGIKTGFTADAGNVLVAAAERHDRRLIAVVMGSADSFADARALLDYGFRRLARGILLPKMTPMTDLVFDPSGTTTGVAKRAVRGIADPDAVTVHFEPIGDLEAPMSRGTRVGEAIVRDGSGVEVGSSPVIAERPVAPTSTGSWFGSALVSLIAGAAAVLPGEG